MADHKINSKIQDFFIIKTFSGSSTRIAKGANVITWIDYTTPAGHKVLGAVGVGNGGINGLMAGQIQVSSRVNIFWYNGEGWDLSFTPNVTLLFMKL